MISFRKVKKYYYLSVLAALLWMPTAAIASTGIPPAHSRQAIIARTVVQIAQQYHYPIEALDKNLANKIINRYTDTMDPGHFYFTLKDIEELHKKFDATLPADLRHGNLYPAFFIYDLYETRVHERIDSVLKLLVGKPDFTSTDTYLLIRKHTPWRANRKTLGRLWKKRIENDALTIMLTGESWKDAAGILKKRYRYFLASTIKVGKRKVLATYLNSYMQALDPHSAYFSPFQAQQFENRASLHSVGIGVTLTVRDGYITLEHILPGSPAARSHELKPGDRIVGIARGKTRKMQNVTGWRLDNILKIIRGKAGTMIRLLIAPAGRSTADGATTISLVRATIEPDSERAEARIVLVRIGTFGYKIGIIRIPSFYSTLVPSKSTDNRPYNIANDVSYLIRQLRSRNVSAILLDLRDNNGGSMEQALVLTGLFISHRPVIEIENRFKKIKLLYPPRGSVPIWYGPLGILVNRLSASATEIFTGTLKNYKRAIVFGSQTWGKGTIQMLIPLKKYLPHFRPGTIKLTIAQYFGIDGSSPQLHGIQPDIDIPEYFDSEKYGEATLSGALPWKKISATSFKRSNKNFLDALSRLRKYYRNKIEKEHEFQLFERELALKDKWVNATTVSLNIVQRRKELAKKRSEELVMNHDWHPFDIGSQFNTLEKPAKSLFYPPVDISLMVSADLLAKYVSFSPSIAFEFDYNNPSLSTPSTQTCRYLIIANYLNFPCLRTTTQIIYPPPVGSTDKGRKRHDRQ